MVDLSVTLSLPPEGGRRDNRKEAAMMRITFSYSKGVLRITITIRAQKDHPISCDMLPPR